MKKLAMLLIAVVGVFVATSCGSKDKAQETPKTPLEKAEQIIKDATPKLTAATTYEELMKINEECYKAVTELNLSAAAMDSLQQSDAFAAYNKAGEEAAGKLMQTAMPAEVEVDEVEEAVLEAPVAAVEPVAAENI